MQRRPIWRCGAPRRVIDSVGDVLGVRRGEQTGSKEPGAPRPHKLLTRATKPGLVTPGGGDQAQRYHGTIRRASYQSPGKVFAM
jgi:hypothetical protein